MFSSLRARNLLFFAMLGLFLAGTNRWMSWDDGIGFLQANDVRSYETIAQAAPLFPSRQIPLHTLYRFAWAALILLTLYAIHQALVALQIDPTAYRLCLALFLTNPYALRYYAIVPGMLQDLVFVFGTAVVWLGLVRTSGSLVVAGTLVAALGRQTAVMLVPAIGAWMFWSTAWRARSARERMLWAILPGVAAGVCYVATSRVVRSFALPSLNVDYLVGLLVWVKGGDFAWVTLGELCLRAAVPFAVSVAVVLGLVASAQRKSRSAWPLPREVWLCLFFMMMIAAQPILAGPKITGQNASRLSALGLVYAVGMVAYAYRSIQPAWSSPRRIVLGAILLLSSLHHAYSVWGPQDARQFALAQFALAAGALACVALAARQTRRLENGLQVKNEP